MSSNRQTRRRLGAGPGLVHCRHGCAWIACLLIRREPFDPCKDDRAGGAAGSPLAVNP
jgi:hypothetical protein